MAKHVALLDGVRSLRGSMVVGLIGALALPACAAGPDDESDDAAAETDGVEGETEGEPEGETDEPEGETEGETDEPEGDGLEACRELPGADGWTEGEALAPEGESTEERISAIGDMTWPLGLELLRVIPRSEHASLAASPTSMAIAMGLAHGRYSPGDCGDRIVDVIGYPERDDALHNTLGAAIRELESRQIPEGDNADPVVLSLRQSLWTFDSDDVALGDQAALYGAKPNAWFGDRDEARDVINCVIESESKGLLPDFLPKGQPAQDTTAYDVNVSYLQAPWSTAMTTRNVPFTNSAGTSDLIDGFGNDLASVRLYEGEDFLGVDVPLRGGALSVFAVMPPEGTDLTAFVDGLEAEALLSAREEAYGTVVDLSMPLVNIESTTLDYNSEDRLNFDCEPFTLRAVLHGSTVVIDEKGIKAAAATVAEEWQDGAPEADVAVEIDRPFLFFVVDNATNFVLYSGRFDPA